MQFVPGNSKPGHVRELRAEMNVLAIFNTCQHPLDPNPNYEPQACALCDPAGCHRPRRTTRAEHRGRKTDEALF